MKMNQYLEEIQKKIEPLNLTVFELVSKIEELSQISQMSFSLEKPLEISKKMLTEYIEQIEIFVNIVISVHLKHQE